MPFGTRRRSRSRLKSAMTMSNSGCVCVTTEKVLIRRFSRVMAVRDTTAYPVCGNAPHLWEAKLTVWSEVDAGTEVELRVPASTVYAHSSKTFLVVRNFASEGMK